MISAIVLFLLRAILVLALYGFIAFSIVCLWKDMIATLSIDQFPVNASLIGEDPGSVFPLSSDNSIGRAVDNAVCLSDETVSAYHARISYQHGQWMLEDLNSRNGTHVNGVLVEASLVITYGDVIEIGKVILTMRYQQSSSVVENESTNAG